MSNNSKLSPVIWASKPIKGPSWWTEEDGLKAVSYWDKLMHPNVTDDFWGGNEMKDFISRMIKLEEQLCVDAISRHLGREATVEDFKKCERHVLEGNTSDFRLIYDGVPLGYIRRITAEPNVKDCQIRIDSSLTFIPEP